jgi:curli biogenesis system outer membrane secretion channel CsgG
MTALLCLFLAGAAQAAPDPMKRVAAELADALSRQKGARVAVLSVPHHDNRMSEGPQMISERLTTYLVMDKRIHVLERNHIVQLLKELHMSETGLVDPASAKRIGEVLGADVIVTGTLIDLDGNQSEINVRALVADSGRVVAASRAVLERNWESPRVLHRARAHQTVLDW